MRQAEAPPHPPGGLQGAHVLLVDDCADALMPMAALLEMCGAQVDTADNGFTALERLRQAHFDVLVSDLRMPGMSGVELVRAMRADRELDQPLAIAYTGFTAMATRDVVEAGFDAVLTKPLGIDQLEATIQQLQARSRPTKA